MRFNTLAVALLITACMLYSSCKKKQTPPLLIRDYTEAYKFYLTVNNYEWTYKLTVIDSINKKVDTLTEKAVYNSKESRTDYYRKGNLWGYATWQNNGGSMGCCGNILLIDYDQLNCNDDSLLIYESIKTGITIQIHQFCKRQFAEKASIYKTIPCIKTVQRNTLSDSSSLQINTYFGYEVGLVYREQVSRTKTGKVKTIEINELVSHQF